MPVVVALSQTAPTHADVLAAHPVLAWLSGVLLVAMIALILAIGVLLVRDVWRRP